MRYTYKKVLAASKSRISALICMAAMLAFFALATHAHSDSQHDLKCPSCQAGTVSAAVAQSDVGLEAPQVTIVRAACVDVPGESQVHAPQQAPRAPPA